MKQTTPIRAVLLDLDGVLYVGDDMIAGADLAVSALRNREYRLAAVTNTTTSPRHTLGEKIRGMGIDIADAEIYSPAALAVKAIGKQTARLFVRDVLLDDFVSVHESERPDFVVMGDIGGEGYEPETLKTIFELVTHGASLLALHKNRFWQKPDGLHLDLGTFVAAIEYATDSEATVLGKPSAPFFTGICDALQVPVEATLMVGDDIESDIGGAQRAGMRTALVQTGKYRQTFAKQIMQESDIRPSVIIPSIADLPDAISLL